MSNGRMRAGAQLLLMATDPINRGILRTALEHPVEVAPGQIFRVSDRGHEALFVAFVVERWLQSAPHGPLSFDDPETAGTVAALAEGWSATVVHMLAREPMTLRELDEAIDGLGSRVLKRHLGAMQSTGQVEASAKSDEAIYALTDWARAGIAPLIASARLERRNPMEGMAPIDALDVDAGFRMSLPLLELPRELSGSCRLGLNLKEDESVSLTGVTVRIEEGRVVSCRDGLDTAANAWAAATAADWLDTVIEPDAKRVRTGGDRWLSGAVLDNLHKTLFGVPVRYQNPIIPKRDS
jgi:DNA-binding HxlR family transcriptional regulator